MLKKSRILSILLCFCLVFEQTGFAQIAGVLDISGRLATFSNQLTQDKFRPLHLRSLSYDLNQNNFRLLLDKGDLKNSDKPKLEAAAKILLNYFFIGIALPNDAFWVNLRPDSEDKIIDPFLAETDVGKVLLEADLQLKKDIAKFTSPETLKGREYWNKLYKKAEELLGHENITIPTLNRPWIVPGEIIIRETKDSAYVYKATLKVMLEQDCLNSKSSVIGYQQYQFKDSRLKELNEYSSQLIRDLIIPELTKEVNTSRRYAQLRQVYYSLILAQWFKERFNNKGSSYSSFINKKNLQGLTSKNPWSKTAYFQAYQKSFENGEYNIRQQFATPYGRVIRSYFSGGFVCDIPIPPGPPAPGVPGEKTKGPTKVITISGDIKHTPSPETSTTIGVSAAGKNAANPSNTKVTITEGASSPFGLPAGNSPMANASAPQSDASSVTSKTTTDKQGRIISTPDPKTVRKNQQASEYSDPNQAFSGVDLEHFVHAQNRLAEKILSEEEFRKLVNILFPQTQHLEVLNWLSIPDPEQRNKAKQKAYILLYKQLAQNGYTGEILDCINSGTYEDPRLQVIVTGQNRNPKTQGVYEAVANSLDALGLTIGQFGKGVKQIIDWLKPNGEDRIDVFTAKDGKAYHLTILKDAQGQNYIQIRAVSMDDFKNSAPAGATHGTVVLVTVQDSLPLGEQEGVENNNSQKSIIEGIRRRFPFVASVRITIQIGENAAEKVNGFETKEVIVPAGKTRYTSGASADKFVHLRVSRHTISVSDNGKGMGAETLSRMFVPKEGTKHPASPSGESAREELKRVEVIHDPSLPHRVSFTRNHEVIESIDIDTEDIASGATVEGGLMLEFGNLMDVPESRDQVKIPLSTDSNFCLAVEYAIREIANHPALSSTQKLKIINTIMAGLDGLIRGNSNYKYIIETKIAAQIRKEIAGLIQELQQTGYLILPHDKQFNQLTIPTGKKVIFLHEKIFAWQGVVSLRGFGAQRIPGLEVIRKVDGKEVSLPVLTAQFTGESLRALSAFDPAWFTLKEKERIPLIVNGQFVVIPLQFGARLLELAKKRLKGLDQKETEEFSQLLELVNIVTSEKVATSYEITKAEENIRLRAYPEFTEAEQGPDKKAIDDFLRHPPDLPEKADVSGFEEQPRELLEQILRSAEIISNSSDRSRALAQIAKSLAEAGDAERALQVAETIPNYSGKSQALMQIAESMAQAGDTKGAQELLKRSLEMAETIQDDFYKSFTLAEIAGAMAEAGDTKGARKLLKQALELAKTIEDGFYKSFVLEQIAESLAKAGDTKGTRELFKQTIQIAETISNSLNKSSTLMQIAKSMAKTGDTEQTRELFKQATQIAETISNDSNKSSALAQIAISMAKAGDIEASQELFKQSLQTTETIKDQLYRSDALAQIVKSLAEAGDIERALQVAEAIPEDSCKSDALAQIAESMAKLGDTEQALQVTGTIPYSYDRSRALAQIAKSLAEAGDIDTALRIAEAITENSNKSSALARIAISMAEAGDTRQAQELLQQAFQAAEIIPEDSSKSHALAQIAGSLAKIGDIRKTEEGSSKRMRELFERSLRITESITNSYLKSGALARIAISMAKAGNNEKAQDLFEQSIQIAKTISENSDKSDILAQIAGSMAEAGNREQAIKIAETISNEFYKSSALIQIAISMAKTGDIERTLQIAKAIPNDNFKSNALVQIAESLTKARDIERIIQTAEAIPNDYYKSGALEQIAKSLAKAGDIERAIQVAETITSDYYKSLALAQIEIAISMAKAGNIERAIQIAEAIPDYSDKSSALAQIAISMAKAGDIEASQELFKQALQTTETIKDQLYRSHALEQIAKSLAEAGDIDTALRAAEAIPEDSVKSHALAQIAESMAELGDTERALQVAETIPYSSDRSRALAQIAKSLAEAGDIDTALRIAEAIPEDSDKSSALARIAASLAKIGDIRKTEKTEDESFERVRELLEQAFQTAKAILKNDTQSLALLQIAKSIVKTGDIEKVQELLKQVIQTVEAIPEDSYKFNTLAQIAGSLAETGNIDMALQVAETIPEDFCKSDALAQIAESMAKTGDIERALQVAKIIPKDSYKSGALAQIARLLAETGDIERAQELLKQALQTAKTILEDSYKFNTLAQIAGSLARAGDVEKALQIAETITSDYYKSGALTQIAKSMAEIGNIKMVLQIIEAIPEDSYKAYTLTQIAEFMAKTGDIKQAQEFLKQVLQIVETIPDSYNKSSTLAQIAKSMAEAGDIERALQIAETITSDYYKSGALIQIAELLAEAGDIERALRAAEAIPNDSYKSSALARIAISMAEAGDIERAQELLKQALQAAEAITDSPNKSGALVQIAESMAKTGDVERALQVAKIIPKDSYKSQALAQIAKSLAETGDIERALQTAGTIPENFYKSGALVHIAGLLAETTPLNQKSPVPSPESPSPDKTKNRQEMLDAWNKEVLSRRDAYIQQAKTLYKPLLELIPEEFRPEIERRFESLFQELYRKQEKEIRTRFQQSLSEGEPADFTFLPFDQLVERTAHIQKETEKFLSSEQAELIRQEDAYIQDQYYLNLFKALLNLSFNLNLDIFTSNGPALNSADLHILGLGWEIKRQEQIKNLPVIRQFMADLNKTSLLPLSIEEANKIMTFLSELNRRPEYQSTLIRQLSKLLISDSESNERLNTAKKTFLAQMRRAFKQAELPALISFLDSPEGKHTLGQVRPFVVFLSHDVKPVRTKAKESLPSGEDIALPREGVEISQIINLEAARQKSNPEDTVMDMEYLLSHIEDLPERSDALENDIIQNVKVQGEAGAYAREIAQNSRDATCDRNGELEVSFYIQQDAEGIQEYVEEARDNGTGALKEATLLIPKSTKAEGEQVEMSGFFGTGKYTIFEGADKVEIITKNKERAYMFIFTVSRDSSANPRAVHLSGIREITDPGIREGVTVRRIKSLENTIPELDQMLAEETWRTFTGLSQDGHFNIFLTTQEGERRRLEVKTEVLSEVELNFIKPGGSKRTGFGPIRIISTEDMPLQILDAAGLRVRGLSDEEINRFMELVPKGLLRHIKELGINIQIPLPLIRNRSAFEHEQEYLPLIQRYVAIAFYKAIAYKSLNQTNPQFVFEGFPLDWETNDDYWDSINVSADRTVVEIARKINQNKTDQIENEELRKLLPPAGRLDQKKEFVKLIILLDVPVEGELVSLIGRRIAIQREIDRQKAESQRQQLGISNVPALKNVPYFDKKVGKAEMVQQGHNQMQEPEKYLVDPADYTAGEKEFLKLVEFITSQVGIIHAGLVEGTAFAGVFMDGAIYLNRNLARGINKVSLQGEFNSSMNTIIHELAHYLEDLMDSASPELAKGQIYVTEPLNFTHDSIGTFAEAMKYLAALTLAKFNAPTDNDNRSPGSPRIPEDSSRNNATETSGSSRIDQSTDSKFTKSPALNNHEDKAEEVGGIDFRILPIVNQQINAGVLKLSYADLNRLSNINLNSEWSDIQNMIKSNIIPSTERIKEYVLANCLKQNIEDQMNKILGCIADIMRIEEDRVIETDTELENVLVLIEAGRPGTELQCDLSQIKISPQQPKPTLI